MMIPKGLTLRGDLQLAEGVLALGLAGERVSDITADQLLGDDLLAYLLEAARETSLRVAVLDLRNVRHLSSRGMGTLMGLQRQLRKRGCRIVLLVNSDLRSILSVTRLDRLFAIVASEVELRALLTSGTAEPEPPLFTRAELAELDATSVTLDDAIRAIEQLRG
ncbi:MAG: STAS domain-containing protein [Gemmataceae bacterium]|nr:STAS domain-containing protein [Gemmataceae bacterium]